MEKKTWDQAKFEEATQPSLNDLGDIGDFENPSEPRSFQIADYYLEIDQQCKTFEIAVNRTCKKFHISKEEFINAIKNELAPGGRYEGYEHFEFILEQLLPQVQESIEDEMGSTDDFESPSDELLVKVSVPWEDPNLSYMGAWQFDGQVVKVSRKHNHSTLYAIIGKRGQKHTSIPKEWCTPALNESIEDDLGDMGDFEEPPSVFSVLVHIPDDATSHREVWKFDGKVVRVMRPPGSRKYYNTGTLSIPVEWCTQVLDESVEDELGDVSEFEGPALRAIDFDNIIDNLSKRAWRVLTDPAPDGIVAADADLSIETKLRRLVAQYGNNWQNIEMALIDRYNKMYEAADLGDVGNFEEPKGIPIVKSCGVCGSPIGPNGEDIYPVPSGYDPDDYEHDYCKSCGNEAMADQNQREYITHEMAMDAQDPDLEGQLW